PQTAQDFSDNIDVDVSAVLSQGQALSQAAQHLRAAAMRVASGSLTRSEVLGDTEISISRIELGFARQYGDSATS
ncbi:MAG TPA: UxaA family hydrolase, partial [Alcaligenes sp.]|nr:UxaA family hydrolase [Alcaligenes sp.]HRL28307.1 UxaA family hydrolase [Alcaligenes sp.]